jgi:mRNA-degrading endonuclease toxin of MazEF toxin-antitoxin module
MSLNRLNEIIVVPATRTIRGLTTEVVLTIHDGMPVACALKSRAVSDQRIELKAAQELDPLPTISLLAGRGFFR